MNMVGFYKKPLAGPKLEGIFREIFGFWGAGRFVSCIKWFNFIFILCT